MIRILIADLLGQLGHTIAAEAGHVDQALELAQSVEFDLAVLDVNLRGEMVTPVAKLITARGRRIIFAIAYGTDVLPEEFRDQRVLQKPFELDGLAKAIDEVTRSRGA